MTKVDEGSALVIGQRRSGPEGEVWYRISGFLSARSPNTQETYLAVVREWCRFLGADAGTKEAAARIIRADDIHAMAYRSWLEKQRGETPRWLKSRVGKVSVPAIERAGRAQKKVGLESSLSNATIAKKFAVLRRIYRMLLECGLEIKYNPFSSDRVKPPPRDSGRKRPTEMITFDKVKEILSIPDPATAKGAQDRAILSVFFGGGLRRSEVLGLRVGDVRTSRGGTTFLYLRSTKSGKDYEQALPKWAANAVWKHWQGRKEQGALLDDFLFVSFRGRGAKKITPFPLSPSGLYKLFVWYCRRAGIVSGASPHSARATAITKLLADGVPYRQVQDFSRHSSVKMVELYDKRRAGVDESPGRDLDYDEESVDRHS